MFRLSFQKSDMPARGIAGPIIIGRKPPADVLIPDPTVSASHAKLSPRDEDTWTIEDLKSTAGTFVNGRRVQQAVIRPGDIIQIGKQTMVLEMTGGPSGTELMLGVATMYNAAPVDEPQAALILIEGSYPERVTTLKKEITSIGRGMDNVIALKDDTKASAAHAIIMRTGTKWFITDAGSINGTKVNGRRIEGETALAHGCKVLIGEHVFQFVIKGAEEAEQTVPATNPPDSRGASTHPEQAGLFGSQVDLRENQKPKGGGKLVLILVILTLVLVLLLVLLVALGKLA
jgi:pSer/pThr/pTyr-binding forkhead associated (FHA) protein